MIRICPPQLDAAPAIDRLLTSVKDALVPPDARLESLTERLSDPDRVLRIAWMNGQPVGVLDGQIEGSEGQIAQLAVHPRARFRGVGRALVRSFAEEAHRRGADRLRAWVIDPGSEGFWDSLAFQRDFEGAYRRGLEED